MHDGLGEHSHVEDVQTITREPAPALPELCARIHAKVEAFLNTEARSERVRQVQAQSRISLGVIEEALSRYREDELSISYNGGKDCLVLLVLYLSALHAHHQRKPRLSSSPNATTTTNNTNSTGEFPRRLRSVYIVSKNSFQEVDDFVNVSVQKYHLALARYTNSMRDAFTDYLRDYPTIKAIFVGTRRTDPHGADLTHFARTDRGWPDFMRIHPVIDWHYAEIWTFIRELGVEYCSLYDLGYTSLGGTTDTHPNPALAVQGDLGGGRGFRPAYELLEDEEERLGRNI